jgi:hypothetical protein
MSVPSLLHEHLTIRPAAPSDERHLRDLAELDGHRLPAGERLVAATGDRVVAAVDVRTGTAISDPFVRTAPAVELLRLRARQLAG